MRVNIIITFSLKSRLVYPSMSASQALSFMFAHLCSFSVKLFILKKAVARLYYIYIYIYISRIILWVSSPS